MGIYLWLVLKNVIGWALILASGPVGLTVPGPGGLPLFIIGFAMITFPGKRALTSRVLRGRPWRQQSARTIVVEILVALLLPALVVWVLSLRFRDELQSYGPAAVFTVYALAVVASFMLVRLGLRLLNYGVTFVPALRRKIRPWLRHHGFDLLPPRRRKRLQHHRLRDVNSIRGDEIDTGILEFSPRFHDRLRSLWRRFRIG
ncbi:MAG TPA: hypothetical protein VLI90_14145 [Tepidisphaeraceae bacterium]|nr:hypothetical protein [Tepidisphaeraceae bacterium]